MSPKRGISKSQTQVTKEAEETRMQAPNEIAVNLGELFLKLIRQAVREEIRTLIRDLRQNDRLLTVQESARMLAVSPDWLYRNAIKLPFTRKLGPKMLRFLNLELNNGWLQGRHLLEPEKYARKNRSRAGSTVFFWVLTEAQSIGSPLPNAFSDRRQSR